MSSILKALKKLETESPNKGDIRSLPMVRRTAKSARHRAKGSHAVYRGIIILFIVVILAGGTWFIFDRKPRDISSSPGVVTDTKTASPDTSHKEDAEPQVARQPEPAAKAVTMAASSVREPVGKTAEPETEISSPSPAVTDTKTASPDTSHKENAEPVAEIKIKDAKSIAVPEKKTAMPDLPLKKEIIAQAAKQPDQTAKVIAASIPAKSTPEENPPPETAEAETKPETPSVRSDENAPMQASEQNKASSRSYVEGYEQSEPLDPFAVMPKKSENDSGLRLQAIAWSEDPKQRMAVINNNIVREGGSVEGAAVTHIGEDMVVFKKEGEEWRQVFRLR